MIGRLAHPRRDAVPTWGRSRGRCAVAMEFLEGMALSELMRAKHPPLNDAVGLGVQLAEALDYAHQKGVVHRDVKPSNIVVQPDGQIRITDFGIAHVDDSTATLQTQAGRCRHTRLHVSPAAWPSRWMRQSDIFSLGIILYELTTGRRPLVGMARASSRLQRDLGTGASGASVAGCRHSRRTSPRDNEGTRQGSRQALPKRKGDGGSARGRAVGARFGSSGDDEPSAAAGSTGLGRSCR